MSRFAPESRELTVLGEFYQKVRVANADRDWSSVAAMIDEHASVRTRSGVKVGRQAVLELVKVVVQEKYRITVVGPRGGLISVLIRAKIATRRIEYEQTYRLRNDKIAEIIDLGRTPDQVYRARSQPN